MIYIRERVYSFYRHEYIAVLCRSRLDKGKLVNLVRVWSKYSSDISFIVMSYFTWVQFWRFASPQNLFAGLLVHGMYYLNWMEVSSPGFASKGFSFANWNSSFAKQRRSWKPSFLNTYSTVIAIDTSSWFLEMVMWLFVRIRMVRNRV